MATLCQFYVKICIFQHGFYPPPQPPPFFCPFGISGHIGYHMFFWGSEPNSKVFLIFIEGFPIPSHVWEYPKYRVMPDISGQGCAGRPFIPRGGGGRGKKARKSTNSKFLQKCEKYNITYYKINYNYKINDLNQSYHCSVGPSYN